MIRKYYARKIARIRARVVRVANELGKWETREDSLRVAGLDHVADTLSRVIDELRAGDSGAVATARGWVRWYRGQVARGF